MRPLLLTLLALSACNSDRPQCHDTGVAADAVAVTCNARRLGLSKHRYRAKHTPQSGVRDGT